MLPGNQGEIGKVAFEAIAEQISSDPDDPTDVDVTPDRERCGILVAFTDTEGFAVDQFIAPFRLVHIAGALIVLCDLLPLKIQSGISVLAALVPKLVWATFSHVAWPESMHTPLVQLVYQFEGKHRIPKPELFNINPYFFFLFHPLVHLHSPLQRHGRHRNAILRLRQRLFDVQRPRYVHQSTFVVLIDDLNVFDRSQILENRRQRSRNSDRVALVPDDNRRRDDDHGAAEENLEIGDGVVFGPLPPDQRPSFQWDH